MFFFYIFLSCYYRRCFVCHLRRAKVLSVVHTLSCIVNFKRQLNWDNHTAHGTRQKKRNEWTKHYFTLYKDTLFWFWLYVQQYTGVPMCACVRAFVCWQLSPSFFSLYIVDACNTNVYFGWNFFCANHFQAYSLWKNNSNLLLISFFSFVSYFCSIQNWYHEWPCSLLQNNFLLFSNKKCVTFNVRFNIDNSLTLTGFTFELINRFMNKTCQRKRISCEYKMINSRTVVFTCKTLTMAKLIQKIIWAHVSIKLKASLSSHVCAMQRAKIPASKSN